MSEHWPTVLLFLSGAIKAGLTLDEALTLLEKEAPESLRNVIRRGGSRTDRGRHDGFSQRVERMLPGPDLALARVALMLSHDVGGQAAPLLDQCAQNLQMKLELSERLKALTAQGKVSAWVVGLTPLGLFAGFVLCGGDYMDPLFHSPKGWMILGLALMLVVTGLFLVHRLVKLE